MSSSSSEPEGVRGLLGRSLDTIRDSVPAQYRAIGAALEQNVVQLQIDHETFCVSAEQGTLRMGAPAAAPQVRLRTESQTILALIDGRLDLVDAVVGESISLFGTVSQLVSFNDALSAYLHGAVRSTGQDAILEDFKLLAAARVKGR